MADKTSVFDWTIPNENGDDAITDWPSIARQGLTDIENSFHVSGTKTAAALQTTYPLGMSLLSLSNATAADGGWPEEGSATVLTLRRGTTGDFAYQLHMISSADYPRMRMRSGTSAGWSNWRPVAAAGLPAGTASGTVTWSNTTTAGTKTVAFPAGVFTSPPNITASVHDRRSNCAVQAISSTGFTLALGNNTGGDTMPVQQDWLVDWIAMQNY